MSKSNAEEGELSESSDTEIQPYKALQRPVLQPTKSFTQSRTQQDADYSSSESESSSSSDEDYVSSKRRKLKNVTPVTFAPPVSYSKPNIWSSVLLEEHLEEEIKDFGVVKSFKHIDQSRSVETYDFKRERADDVSDEGSQNEHEARKVLMKLDKKDGSQSLVQEHKQVEENYEQSLEETKKLLEKRKRKMSDRKTHSKQRLKPKFTRVEPLSVTLSLSEIDVAQDIAAKLYENKIDLIYRTIQILGKETAIQLFEETREVENDGGIPTADGSRRRTPGGVFLHLLRQHEHIPMEKIRQVFQEENRMKEKIRRAYRSAKRRQQTAEQNTAENSLPNLPTRAELAMKETLADSLVDAEPFDVVFEDE